MRKLCQKASGDNLARLLPEASKNVRPYYISKIGTSDYILIQNEGISQQINIEGGIFLYERLTIKLESFKTIILIIELAKTKQGWLI